VDLPAAVARFADAPALGLHMETTPPDGWQPSDETAEALATAQNPRQQEQASKKLAAERRLVATDPYQARIRLISLSDGQQTVLIDAFTCPGWSDAITPLLQQTTIVGHNVVFDLACLFVAGCPIPDACYDTMIVAQLL
jgi:ribonuclease D